MIIFPMVGASSRFSSAGYTLPKFMLQVLGVSIFQHIVKQFVELNTTDDFVFVLRADAFAENFVRAECAAAGLPQNRLKIVVLSEMTRGQAETVLRALDDLTPPSDEQITIFNIDTIRLPRPLPDLSQWPQCDGYVELFLGEGEHWSFVDPVDPDAVRAGAVSAARSVAEKKRISDFCSDGLYIFRNAGVFRDSYRKCLSDMPQDAEIYVAPLYQELIDQGRDVRCGLIETTDLHFAGTPEEYEALAAQEAPTDLNASVDHVAQTIIDTTMSGVTQTGYLSILALLTRHADLIGEPKVTQAVTIFLTHYAQFKRFVGYAFLSHPKHESVVQYQAARKPLEPIVFQCLRSLLKESRYSSAAANLASFALLNNDADSIRAESKVIRKALCFIEFPTHSLLFRPLSRQFTPDEVFKLFFTLTPAVPTVSYLFALHLLSMSLKRGSKRQVENYIADTLPELEAKAGARKGALDPCQIDMMKVRFSAPKRSVLEKISARFAPKRSVGSRPKVALLLSGQMRNYTEVAKLFQEPWTADFDIDVFISTWKDRGTPPVRLKTELRGYDPSIRRTIMEITRIHDIDQATFERLYHRTGVHEPVTVEELETAFAAKVVEIDVEGETTPRFGHNQERMFYKISSAFEAAKRYGPYDAYVRIRPDLQFGITGKQIAPLIYDVIGMEPKVIVKNVPLYESQVPFVDDNFCIANTGGMNIYRGTFDAFRSTNRRCMGNPKTGVLKPHEGLAAWLLLNGVEIGFLPKDEDWTYADNNICSADDMIRHLANLPQHDVDVGFVKALQDGLRPFSSASASQS